MFTLMRKGKWHRKNGKPYVVNNHGEIAMEAGRLNRPIRLIGGTLEDIWKVMHCYHIANEERSSSICHLPALSKDLQHSRSANTTCPYCYELWEKGYGQETQAASGSTTTEA